MAQALVLINALTRAKSRLAGDLPASQRQALAVAMLRDVLAALGDSGCFARVSVLAGCEQGAGVAAAGGAEVSLDADLPGTTVNQRIAAWLRCRAADPVEPVLLVHADLPFLSAADVRQFMRQHAGDTVTLATDLARRGTNALLLLPGQLERFAFGADSAARHGELCRERGLACAEIRLRGFARDIDTAGDLDALLRALHHGERPGPATAALLATPAFAGLPVPGAIPPGRAGACA